MPNNQLNLLHQRIKYLKRALAIQREDYQSRKKVYDRIIDKLTAMVNSGDITTYLGIDSVYFHLMEKLEQGEADIETSAKEMRDFIA